MALKPSSDGAYTPLERAPYTALAAPYQSASVAAYNSRVPLSPSIEASSVSSYEFADHNPVSESDSESEPDVSKGNQLAFQFSGGCSEDDTSEEYELAVWHQRRNKNKLRRRAV